jgi:glycine C-acetyltransferase
VVFGTMRDELREELGKIRSAGLYKDPRPISSAQSSTISVGPDELLNFCSNNYLGLANHPEVIEAAKVALDDWGFGMASVRFICGTQDPHTQLEKQLSEFLRTEDAILYGSCFDANGGVFETILGEHDVVISDELNHASIIDGIRLCKAARRRYRNRDMADLEEQLIAAQDARHRLIVTDGVFSMDGYVAPLDEICALADTYDALVMVDDSHAVGFVGDDGRGTPELFGVHDRIDILTGTLGKALGGASGGYVAARSEIVDLLRQRSRPYLFSNSVAPPIVGASIRVLELITQAGDLRTRLRTNAALFRSQIVEAGFDVLDGDHAIVPVMIGDAATAGAMAAALLDHGVYVAAFSYPVVPMGRARIRVQLSAAHSVEDIRRAVAAFVKAREEIGTPTDQHGPEQK